ncbi:hypothetical protein C8J56DRAFT_898671 [Mycena floridula]|nr:hypothetical protein C8J56DRAFT_898671 [Mycena floridula]
MWRTPPPGGGLCPPLWPSPSIPTDMLLDNNTVMLDIGDIINEHEPSILKDHMLGKIPQVGSRNLDEIFVQELNLLDYLLTYFYHSKGTTSGRGDLWAPDPIKHHALCDALHHRHDNTSVGFQMAGFPPPELLKWATDHMNDGYILHDIKGVTINSHVKVEEFLALLDEYYNFESNCARNLTLSDPEAADTTISSEDYDTPLQVHLKALHTGASLDSRDTDAAFQQPDGCDDCQNLDIDQEQSSDTRQLLCPEGGSNPISTEVDNVSQSASSWDLVPRVRTTSAPTITTSLNMNHLHLNAEIAGCHRDLDTDGFPPIDTLSAMESDQGDNILPKDNWSSHPVKVHITSTSVCFLSESRNTADSDSLECTNSIHSKYIIEGLYRNGIEVAPVDHQCLGSTSTLEFQVQGLDDLTFYNQDHHDLTPSSKVAIPTKAYHGCGCLPRYPQKHL